MTDKTYIVEGCWPFPLDMLRRDGSRAATEADQRIIDEYSQDYSPDSDNLRNPVRITLVGPWAPNTARWESFGWTVPSDTQYAAYKKMWEEEDRMQGVRKRALDKLTEEERRSLGW